MTERMKTMETYEGFSIGERVELNEYEKPQGTVTGFSINEAGSHSHWVDIKFDDGIQNGHLPKDLTKIVEATLVEEEEEGDDIQAIFWLMNNAPSWVCQRIKEMYKKK